MRHLLPLLAVVCALFCAPPVVAQAPEALTERILIDGKTIQRLRYEGAPWARTKDGLTSSGDPLWADELLTVNDGGVKLRLTFDAFEGTGAALRVGGAYIILDGPEGNFAADGEFYGSKQQKLALIAKHATPGKAFDVEVRRTANMLSVTIAGATLSTIDIGRASLGEVGFIPGRAKVSIERWSLLGETAPPVLIARDPQLQAQVEAAIERGVQYLLRQQMMDGSWGMMQKPRGGGFHGGTAALCAYTLLRSGLTMEHPSVQRAFAALDVLPYNETYTAGLMLTAYEASRESKYLPRMKAIAQKLMKDQRGGLWGYPTTWEGDWDKWNKDPSETDLSNTQYAVLGLRAAHHAGIEIPEKVWIEAMEAVLDLQEDPRQIDAPVRAQTDGLGSGGVAGGKVNAAGFGYRDNVEIRPAMVAAGVSVIAIARECLNNRVKGELGTRSFEGIQWGAAWLGDQFPFVEADNQKPIWGGWPFYYAYGIERVGSLLGTELLGNHEWYAEGARWILPRQSPTDGSWHVNDFYGGAHPGNVADTCFAILFLKRASRPTVKTRDFFAQPVLADDPNEAVRLKASGGSNAALWIASLSERTLRKYGNEELGGVRVVKVEYLVDNRVVKTLDLDGTKVWQGEPFPYRHALVNAGAYKLKARLTVLNADAPAGAKEPVGTIESKERTLISEGSLQTWMLEAATWRNRQVAPTEGIKCSASSEYSDRDRASQGLDGTLMTRWLCKKDDAQPMLAIEATGAALKFDALTLHPAQRSVADVGSSDRLVKLSIKVGKEKPVEVTCSANELEPTTVRFEKTQSAKRVEIRILERAPGGSLKGAAGFAEVIFERASKKD